MFRREEYCVHKNLFFYLIKKFLVFISSMFILSVMVYQLLAPLIDSVNNKGYKILSCPDILSESEIKSSLSLINADVLNKIIYLESYFKETSPHRRAHGPQKQQSFLDRVPSGLHPQPGGRAETQTPGHLPCQRRISLQGGL